MLLTDPKTIGNRLLAVRKKAGLTQRDLAESASLSESAYAAIERGSAIMRLDTLMKICGALDITPDRILTQEDYGVTLHEQEVLSRMDSISPHDKQIALKLIDVYLHGLE